MSEIPFERNPKILAWKKRLGIRDEDIVEQFVTSPGKGGQNVNKLATAVQLTHRPTGIMVKCHRERSQAMNRYVARCILFEKIETAQKREHLALISRREKARRQKRGRSAKGKELMLASKKFHSQKKRDRSRPHMD